MDIENIVKAQILLICLVAFTSFTISCSSNNDSLNIECTNPRLHSLIIPASLDIPFEEIYNPHDEAPFPACEPFYPFVPVYEFITEVSNVSPGDVISFKLTTDPNVLLYVTFWYPISPETLQFRKEVMFPAGEVFASFAEYLQADDEGNVMFEWRFPTDLVTGFDSADLTLVQVDIEAYQREPERYNGVSVLRDSFIFASDYGAFIRVGD